MSVEELNLRRVRQRQRRAAKLEELMFEKAWRKANLDQVPHETSAPPSRSQTGPQVQDPGAGGEGQPDPS